MLEQAHLSTSLPVLQPSAGSSFTFPFAVIVRIEEHCLSGLCQNKQLCIVLFFLNPFLFMSEYTRARLSSFLVLKRAARVEIQKKIHFRFLLATDDSLALAL